jgi:hypothetical protein
MTIRHGFGQSGTVLVAARRGSVHHEAKNDQTRLRPARSAATPSRHNRIIRAGQSELVLETPFPAVSRDEEILHGMTVGAR